MKKKVWIDMVSPSHPLFFSPMIRDLERDHEMVLTLRERGETIGLANSLGIAGRRIGKDHDNPISKTISILTRTIELAIKLEHFDYAISFENPMIVVVSKLRSKRSIILLDNDLKMKVKSNLVQKMESFIKFKADHLIVPESCKETFTKLIPKGRMVIYDGFKEDFYVSAFIPDPGFTSKVPFDKYIVVRPEALASFYVENKRSIVPDLVKRLNEEGYNVVYLPRTPMDKLLVQGLKVFIPSAPLNGLDLIHYSNAVLTGSGTMAREGCVMGKPSVSFFPSESLLSVDEEMIHRGWMFHSRDVDEILGYLNDRICRNSETTIVRDVERSKKVMNELMARIRSIIGS